MSSELKFLGFDMATLGNSRAFLHLAVGAVLATGICSPTSATTVQGGQIEDRLPGREPKRATPESTLPSASPQDDNAKTAAFNLKAIDVSGTTVLPKAEIDQITSDFLGKPLSTKDLADLAGRLTAAYRARGFFLSRVIIPPQELSDGTLKARAIEGYVVSAKADGLADDDAKSQFQTLLSERPARLSTFERTLLLLADRYGYQIENTRLVPVEGSPDQFNLQLTVSWKPVSLELFADNRGTARNGEDQSYAGVAWNSLLSAGDQLSASLFTSVANIPDTLYAELRYATPWASGDLWTEFGTSTTTWQDPLYATATLGNFEAQRLWLRASTPILRSRQTSIWLSLLLDGRNSISNDGVSPTRNEKLRVLRGSFSLTEVVGTSRADLNLQVSRGLDGLGGSKNGEVDLSRDDSRPQFTRARLSVSFSAHLVDNWSVNLSAVGQYADGALPSSEQLYFGGARYGRGYDYDIIGGDNGWAASGELRYTINASFLAMDQIQLYAFGDAGRTSDSIRGVPGFDTSFASSAGGGVRLFITPDLTASVEAALPIVYDDSLNVIDTTRIFVSLSWLN